MANKNFNGSTLSFAGNPVGAITGIRVKVGGAWVDVSDASLTAKIYETGLDDEEVQIDIKGGITNALDRGSKGSVSVSFNDGTTFTLANAAIGDVEISGSEDNPIVSSVTIRRSTAP